MAFVLVEEEVERAEQPRLLGDDDGGADALEVVAEGGMRVEALADSSGGEADVWAVPLTTAGAPHPVRLLIDGPALEVWVDGRILGGPVSPTRGLRADGTITAWLVRPGT